MEPEENALIKVDEARFYLELVDQLEIRRRPLMAERDATAEFSYLLSGFLNACYSCTEHLKQRKSNRDRVASFQKEHSQFYGSGPKGGWRTQSVHFRSVEPASEGYHPPPGNNVVLRFRERAEPGMRGNAVNLDFGHGSFYFTEEGQQNSICDLCAVHIHKLEKLIKTCS